MVISVNEEIFDVTKIDYLIKIIEIFIGMKMY